MNFDYSMKNIRFPTNQEYTKRLIEQTESVIKRMRWKTFFYLNPDKRPRKQKETFGFKSRNTPPQVAEMIKFEDDLLHVIANIEFIDSKCHFQLQLRNNVKKMQQSDLIFVSADKTNNFYKLQKDDYDQLLRNNTYTQKITTFVKMWNFLEIF